MTRASLLHILDHVSVISDAEIRELEQLAAAFPYCQTAHILLAKTAHDRGSMLASQRLRRAATYAANRDLLRQLLEQPAPAGVAQVISAGLEVSSTGSAVEEIAPYEAEPSLITSVHVEDIVEGSEQLASDHFSSHPIEVAELISESNPSATIDAAIFAPEEATKVSATSSPQNAEPTVSSVSEAGTSDAESVTGSVPLQYTETALAASETLAFSESEQGVAPNETISEDAEETQREEPTEEMVAIPAQAAPEASVASEMQRGGTSYSAQEQLAAQITEPTGLESETQDDAQVPTPLEPELSNEIVINDLLPATAPPIRPPAEAGISRFEFDLVEPTLPEPSGYLLPDLEEEVAQEPILSEILQRTAPAFHADEDLGYALSAGSRLGYDLQQHDGFTLDLPLDAFFEPDALLLAHIAAHRPKPSTSSLDLINRFLKTKPRIKTAAVDAKPVEEQADLSVRSIQAAPALASESLAKIMVKQGKIDKAIEIYERLMTRQPEKKAYFADQIQQLKQPSA